MTAGAVKGGADALVIIQARTNSSRFAAKSLVTFRGYPIAVLAAKRAATRGHEVVLATSDAATDDLLAVTAQAAGITVVRGSLDDVLGRFCQALGSSADDRIVVRLTGDNILPDGDLIAEVVAALEASGAAYISTSVPEAGLPYGLSVEAMRAGDLRASDRAAETEFQREHVTPWIRQHLTTAVFDTYAGLAMAGYRATIDCFDDLMSMHRVFPEGVDPVQVPWRDCADRLPQGLFQPGAHVTQGDLVLGTAQLGMAYGINRAGSPTGSEARDMIRNAVAGGVQWVDTARAYGKSEGVLGSVLKAGWQGRFRVITKLDPLADWSGDDDPKGVLAAAKLSLMTSRHELGVTGLDTLMLHRWQHWTAWGGAVAGLLREEQAAGRITALGASVQSPEELAQALDVPEITHVQLPLNILDHRWHALDDRIVAARRDRGLIVHVRSALLQGLLLSTSPELWGRAHVTDMTPVTGWLRDMAAQHCGDAGPDGLLALCLGWVRSVPWVDGVVVGMDNSAQLETNLRLFSAPLMTPETVATLGAARPVLAPETLDPARWSAA